jgi:hypothetical protein
MYAVDGTISLAACVALYMLLRRLSSTGRAGALS